MGARLPPLSAAEFARRLGPQADELIAARLFAHYEELSRWNPMLSLVGPGTADVVVERHYGEALAGVELLDGVRSLVDLGSGAGFPGFVLAACRPDVEVTLVEAKQRKVSFLLAAARRAQLSLRCLNVRVSATLPQDFPRRVDLFTSRALRLPEETLLALDERLSPGGRWACWSTREALVLSPALRVSRVLALPNADERAIYLAERS
jgi:16S rRNA (guanine527-N7)-methyltransferase